MTINLEQQIASVRREIRMREIVYPKRVADKKMKAENASYEIDAMRAVLATLTAIASADVPIPVSLLKVRHDKAE